MIFNLEDGLKELLEYSKIQNRERLEETHEAKLIEKYIKLCQEIENFDFSKNIELATEKLKDLKIFLKKSPGGGPPGSWGKLNVLKDIQESVSPPKTEPSVQQGKWNNQNQKMKTSN